MDRIEDATLETKGLRLFLAMRPRLFISDGRDHSFSSHTLITPANRIPDIDGDGDRGKVNYSYYDDTLIENGKSFLLDLTTPCPLACPENYIFSNNVRPVTRKKELPKVVKRAK